MIPDMIKFEMGAPMIDPCINFKGSVKFTKMMEI